MTTSKIFEEMTTSKNTQIEGLVELNETQKFRIRDLKKRLKKCKQEKNDLEQQYQELASATIKIHLGDAHMMDDADWQAVSKAVEFVENQKENEEE